MRPKRAQTLLLTLYVTRNGMLKEKTGVYERVTDDFVTLDTDLMQHFVIHPPLETQNLRVICTTNAAQTVGFRCIGFFDIEFS